MFSAIGHFADSVAHDVSHGAGDVVHGAESAAKTVAHVATGAAKDVGHAAGNAAKTVAHVATGAAKDVGHAVGTAAKTVAHTASSAANSLYKDGKKAFTKVEDVAKGAGHEVGKVAGDVGKTVSKAAGRAVGDVKDAAQHASSFLGGVWHSVAHGASSLADGAAKGVSSAVNGVEHLGKSVAKDVDNGYHDLRHDAKQALISGAGFASKLGLGSALDDVGLGGVNEKNVKINKHITSTYYNQSKELQQVLGPGSGANWATFASWASNRAGQAIQNNDDPGGRFGRDVDQLLSDVPQPVADALGGILGGATQSEASKFNKDYQDESTQAAAGNQKVFKDIDPHIQQFINTFKGVKAPDQAKWNQFAATFHGQEGDMLAGFKSYYNAMFQTGSQKAQSITAGNLQLGLHEQKLLQPNIAGAFPPGQGATYTAGQKVRVGNQVLALNQNIPADPSNGGQDYPSDLQNVTNPQLKQILSQWGPSSGTLQGSGAQNWANLQDRMQFISGLMMSRYNDPSLFQNPLNTNPQ